MARQSWGTALQALSAYARAITGVDSRLQASVTGHNDRPHLPGGRPDRLGWCGGTLATLTVLTPELANALTPGLGTRLVGPQAQGPATAAVSALHHNPAMLVSLPGLQLTAAGNGGVDILTVRPFVGDSRGQPTGQPGDPVTLVNPAAGYFLGFSYQLDPIAVGAGVYDLSSRIRPWSSEELRYHLAPDPDVGCTSDPRLPCPEGLRSGGMHEVRTDYTVAIAWSVLDRLQLGVAFHVPRLRVHLSHDNDTRLMSSDDGSSACAVDQADVGEPRCAERLSFSGRSQLAFFGLRRENGTRFDFATTFGVAWRLGKHGRVGLRYRTRPWLNRGEVDVNGLARVCRSEQAVHANPSGLASCTLASPMRARLSQPLARELAIGAAWVLGGEKRWQVDGNAYWMDACPGGTRLAECGHRDAQRLSLVGLSHEAAVLPEHEIYRGRQDLFGGKLFARYDLWKAIAGRRQQEFVPPRVSLGVGAGVRSPAVSPAAMTPSHSDGWTVSADLGPRIELVRQHGSWIFLPGYALDVLIPRRVGPGGVGPAFDPEAGLDFSAAGSDIHAPSADAVIHGRARATNAGVYSGSAHILMFALRWSERG